jgi:hypothetical protein
VSLLIFQMQVDPTPNHAMNLTPRAPNFSTGDFPALPTAEDQNGFSKGNVDVLGIFNGRGSSTISGGAGDFVSAVRKLASQNSGHWKFKKGPEYGNGVSSHSVPKQYSTGTKQSSGNKFQSVSSARVAPWLETGDAVGNASWKFVISNADCTLASCLIMLVVIDFSSFYYYALELIITWRERSYGVFG